MSYQVTKNRVVQYIGIILIIGVFAGAYWYFQVFAGVKTNSSLTDSLSEGLAGYWKLDDGSGTSATDSSTNGNTGTLTNGPTWTTGQIGGAVDFDGTNDYIDVGTAGLTSPTRLSGAAWINSTVVYGVDHAVFSNRTAGNQGWSLVLNSSAACGSATCAYLQFIIQGVASYSTTAALVPSAQWAHIAFSWDGSRVSFYINGAFIESKSTGAMTTGTNMLIGALGPSSSTSSPMSGKIDEARIYNRTISDDEASQLYRLNSPTGVDTSLKGYWSFDGKDISGTAAYDRSGASNTGTLTNGPATTQGKVGQAIDLDGTDDYVTIADNSVLDFGDTADLTLSGWFYRDTFTTDDTVIAKRNGITSTDTGYLAYIDDATDQLIFEVSDGTDEYSLTSMATFTTTGWYHYAIVWDQDSGANSEIYINGIANNATDTGTIGNLGDLSNAVVLAVGAESDAGNPFDGKLDEVRVYNAALTTAQIQSLYKAGESDKMNVSDINGNLNSGLVGYWPHDNGSGTSVTDSSTNGNSGTLTNGPTWTTGQIGSAVDFDGTNDYIDIPASSSLNLTTTETLSAWIYMDAIPSSGSTYQIFHKYSSGDSNSYYSFLIYNLSGQVQARFLPGGGGVYTPSNTSLSAGQWYHVVVTFNLPLVSIYINGVLDKTFSDSVSGGFASGTGTAKIGGLSGSNYFNGKIDEMRVYNRALSGDEVAQLYRYTGPAAADSGLVGHWSFNGTDTTSTKAYDRSGSGNTGTLTNGPATTQGKVGQGLSFDGTNDYMTTTTNFGTASTLKTLTLSAWFKTSTGSGVKIIGLDSNQTGTSCVTYDRMIWMGTDGKVRFGVYTSSAAMVASSSTFNDNQWHHAVGVSTGDNGTAYLYIDGALQGSTSISGTLFAYTNSYIRIGGICTAGVWTNGADSYYAGSLDEVRIYNRALSAAEIQAQYAAGQSDEVNTGASQAQGTGRLDSGLAGYWKLDDGSGTSATDSSTNGSNGTLTNGPTWTTGQIGSAVDFDGADDVINAGSDTSLDDIPQRTVSIWIKPDSLGENSLGYILRKIGAALTNGWVLFLCNSSPTDCPSTANTITLLQTGSGRWHMPANSVSFSGSWIHVVFTYDRSSTANDPVFYLNGVKVATTEASTPSSITSDAAADLLIGNSANGDRTFDGSIDEVRIYNRILTEGEVSQLYRLTSPTGTDTGLKGYWSFNGKDLSGTTAYDRSGAGNTGTLTNGPTVTPGKIGQALSFDGTNDYVSVTSVASLRPSLPFSFSFWIKPTTVSTNQGFFGSREAIQHDGFWSASSSDGSISISYGAGTDCSSDGRRTKTSPAATLVAGQWQHIVGTLRGPTDMTIYVNGVDVGGTYSGTGGSISYIYASILRLGGHGGSGGCGVAYLNGSMDEVRLYNRELTTAEITALYNASK